MLKETVNAREQQARNLTVRLNGLALSEDKSCDPDPAAAAAKNAYEQVIRPLLVATKNAGKISSTPTLPNIISKAFRSHKVSGATAPPPPIIIHLSSPTSKSAILSMRREFLPKPNDADRARGVKRLYLSEDLTPPANAFLKRLKDDSVLAGSGRWTGRSSSPRMATVTISSTKLSLFSTLSTHSSPKSDPPLHPCRRLPTSHRHRLFILSPLASPSNLSPPFPPPNLPSSPSHLVSFVCSSVENQ
jgi:hypothetical protein